MACMFIPLVRRTATAGRAEFHHNRTSSVSRLGGIAFVAAFLGVALLFFFHSPKKISEVSTAWVVILSSVAMFGLGFWDDLKPIGAKKKLAGQLVIASCVYFAGVRIATFKIPFAGTEYELGALGFLATVSWLVVLTNLINLIDGIDGLAGGISLMLMCLLAYVGIGVQAAFSVFVSVGLAGALLGFLYFNYPPAKIYMGDGGAYFLGFVIGILSIVNSHKGSVAAALIAPLFALALPILDVSLAIVRRGLKGLPFFRPDRKHIHHRLMEFGFSRQRTILTLYGICFLCLFLAFAIFWSQGQLLPLLAGFLFLIFLIAARSHGITMDWFNMGSLLGKLSASRKETRYALVLSEWLTMEAERCDSIYQLWQCFQFLVKKLGFSEVKLTLADTANVWRAGVETQGAEMRRIQHEIGGTKIEFMAETKAIPEKLFELLAELATEGWYKAGTRWQELNQAPLRFVSAKEPGTSFLRRKFNRPFAQCWTKWWLGKADLEVQ